MRYVLRGLGIVAAVVMAAGAVHAADMPVKAPRVVPTNSPTYNWSGAYFGAHVGYLWSSTQVKDFGFVVEPSAKTDGILGGVLAGYNHQVGNWVLGLDGDFAWADAHGNGPALPPEARNQYDLRWTGHVRGRVGYAPNQGPLLLFIAGGLAVSRFTFTDGDTLEKASSTYTGASFGGGAEYGFGNRFSARVEFLYDNYRMSSNLVMLHDYSAKLQHTSTVRAAVNFKLN